jgi:ATP-dependent Clp protease protease subunit
MTLMEDLSHKGIVIKINSVGGDLVEAFAIIDRIRHSPCKITTLAYGEVCSAAALIFLAGDKRIMSKWSRLMLHEVSSEVGAGRVSAMNEDVKYLSDSQKMMESYIREATGLKELSWEEILKKDYWINSKEAYSLGIIDKIK